MIFRQRGRREEHAAVAEADPPPASDAGPLLAEIDRLERESGEGDDPHAERDLVRLRHQAAVKLVDSATLTPDYPAPSPDLPVVGLGELPEFRPADLTPELLRAAILRDGCALVRGMVDRDRASELGESCRRLFEWREAGSPETTSELARYEEFVANPPYEASPQLREWLQRSGGIWLVDSPKLMAEVFDLYERAGLRRLINGYFDERPVFTVNKSTLRRARSSTSQVAFHQDGAFMGDAPALNVWMSLSRCGDVAPGLALIPRRIDHILPTGTPGAAHDWSVSPEVAAEAAGDAGVLSPVFEPGDLILFDDLFLHATWVDSEMPDTRYAIESWFFSPSRVPSGHAPLVF